MENNKAICRKTDEHFTEGKEYECTSAYAKYESAVVDILDNNKEFEVIETTYQGEWVSITARRV